MPRQSFHPHARRRAAAAPSLTCLLALALLTGCATTPPSAPGRAHVSTPSELSNIRTTAALPPTLVLSQLTAGGVKEQRDDWTQAARKAARETLENLRPGALIYAEDFSSSPELAAEVQEIQALYRSIDLNIAVFGNPMVGLPTAAGRFDYSVGSVDKVCDALGADAILLIYGEDDYFTSDRKALVALGVIAGAFTGVNVQPSSGTEHVSAALVARNGTLLWHGVLGPGRIGDLRKAEGVQATLRSLLGTMPFTGRARSS